MPRRFWRRRRERVAIPQVELAGLGAVGACEILGDLEVQGGRGSVDPGPLFIGEIGQQGAQVVEGELV
ncbi:hypothetical protein [Streptomyces halstedii]|uniref:hypothetical protein n=1 Tax=Streptomyces halstedii TaxID=1944 RepID=UPI003349F50A